MAGDACRVSGVFVPKGAVESPDMLGEYNNIGCTFHIPVKYVVITALVAPFRERVAWPTSMHVTCGNPPYAIGECQDDPVGDEMQRQWCRANISRLKSMAGRRRLCWPPVMDMVRQVSTNSSPRAVPKASSAWRLRSSLAGLCRPPGGSLCFPGPGIAGAGYFFELGHGVLVQFQHGSHHHVGVGPVSGHTGDRFLFLRVQACGLPFLL